MTISPVTPVTNGADVSASNPLPVTLIGGSPVITSYTFATLPTPTAVAGKIAFVTNLGAKGTMMMSDGTRWKVLNGMTLLSSMDTVSSNIANTDTIVHQTLVPAGVIQTGDRILYRGTMTKSGNTDTGLFRIHIGTAGTTSDTALFFKNILVTTNVEAGFMSELRLASATTIQPLGVSGASNGVGWAYSAVATGAIQSPVTISSATTNPLYISLSIQSNSTNDTVALLDAQIYLISSAN